MKAELTYRTLHRVVQGLAPTAGRSRTGILPLVIAVTGANVTFTAGSYMVSGQVTTSGGMADGQTAVDPKELARTLAAVAPTGRGRAARVVRLCAEPGQLRLTAASTGTLATVAAVDVAPPADSDLVVAVPVRTWLAALAAVVIATDTRSGYPQGLRALRLWPEPGCCLVLEATDRYRAHRVIVGEPQPDRHEYRVSADVVRAAARILALADHTDTVQVQSKGDMLIWQAGTVTVAVRTAGTPAWPVVERVFEAVAGSDLRFTTDAAAATDSLRRAKAASGNTRSIDVDIDPAGGTMTVTVPGPDGQPPRISLPVPIRAARGPACRTRLVADRALQLFTVAGGGEVSVAVNTGMSLMGVFSGTFSGAMVHSRRTGEPSAGSPSVRTKPKRSDAVRHLIPRLPTPALRPGRCRPGHRRRAHALVGDPHHPHAAGPPTVPARAWQMHPGRSPKTDVDIESERRDGALA